MRIFHFSFFIFIILLLFSCLKEDTDEVSDWNPNFSIAVGHSSLSMNEESGFDTELLLINPTTGLPYWTEEIDIPLSYTMPFDMGQLSDFSEEIVSFMFRINLYNGFPNVSRVQVYFIDITENIIDSLFSSGHLTMQPGTVIGNGETINPTHSQTDVIFDQSKIDELITVRSILVEGEISNVSLDTTLIDFYPNYSLGIQLGLQAELSMNISEEFLNQNNQ
jgi:hypothetical protein